MWDEKNTLVLVLCCFFTIVYYLPAGLKGTPIVLLGPNGNKW
jgi:hypothetical protein